MLNENNQGQEAEQQVDKQVRYSIRKMKVGVVSVAVASGLIFSSSFLLNQVHAETLGDASQVDQTGQMTNAQSALVDESSPVTETGISTDSIVDIDAVELTEIIDTTVIENQPEHLSEVSQDSELIDEPIIAFASTDSSEVMEIDNSAAVDFEAITATDEAVEAIDATSDEATIEAINEATNEAINESDLTIAEEAANTIVETDAPATFAMSRNRVFAATETDEAATDETEINETPSDLAPTTADTSSETTADVPIEAGYFRLNFEGLTDEQLASYGLWYWGDVTTPSDTVGGWPDGATSFSTATATAFGHYLDVELKENAQTINFLINTRTGDNVTPDLSIDLMSPNMNQAYITEDYAIKLYEQLEDEGLLRINYYREDGNYDGWGLWAWGDVAEPTTEWPTGAHEFINEGAFGRYVDLSLAEAASNINFLIVNRDTGEQSNDMTFNDRETHSQVFIKDLDKTVYTNPYYARVDRLETAEIISDSQIELNYSSVESLSEAAILEEVTIVDAAGNQVEVTGVVIDAETGKIQLTGAFDYLEAPYTVQHGDQSLALQLGWRIKDELYAYDGELGMALHEDGTAEMAFWSPSADQVNIVLYDKTDQNRTVNSLAMTKEDRGVWRLELNEEKTDLTDLTG